MYYATWVKDHVTTWMVSTSMYFALLYLRNYSKRPKIDVTANTFYYMF